MRLYYATTNAGKVRTLTRDLAPYGVEVVQRALTIDEPRHDDVEAIAQAKVERAFAQLQAPVVALDAGFYIFGLKGFPRAYVNFTLDTIDLDGILKLAEGTDRRCEFRECLAYREERMDAPARFTAHVPGTLTTELRGTVQSHLWSRLGLIFVPDGGDGRTLAEMPAEEVAAWRERTPFKREQLEAFVGWLRTRGRIPT